MHTRGSWRLRLLGLLVAGGLLAGCTGPAQLLTQVPVPAVTPPPSPATTPGGGQAVAAGQWGGDQIGLMISDAGATYELGCAHGSLDQPLLLDATGHFAVTGTYVQEHGGPVDSGAAADTHPARYTGQVSGQTLTLTITLTDQGTTIGTFTATQGRQPHVVKCM